MRLTREREWLVPAVGSCLAFNRSSQWDAADCVSLARVGLGQLGMPDTALDHLLRPGDHSFSNIFGSQGIN